MKKTQPDKGFIQVSILVAIIMGVFAVGSAGYIGVEKYQSNTGTSAPERSEVEQLRQEVEQLKREQSSSPQTQPAPAKKEIMRIPYG